MSIVNFGFGNEPDRGGRSVFFSTLFCVTIEANVKGLEILLNTPLFLTSFGFYSTFYLQAK